MPDQETPALVENMLLLRKEDFDDLLDRAAERGAERCLAHLGLENGHAARDIRELRDLLEAWREARHNHLLVYGLVLCRQDGGVRGGRQCWRWLGDGGAPRMD